MAKFILDYIAFSDGSNHDGDIGTISNVIVESLESSITPNTVVIDNGQTINESYTTSITFRTRNTTYDATSKGTAGSGAADGQNILGGAASPVITDGVLPSAKSYIRVKGGTFNMDSGAVYINGYEDFSNGRREIVISATIESTAASTGLSS